MSRGGRRRAPIKPTKIARLRNTPQTAVQHDEMSGRPGVPAGRDCLRRGPHGATQACARPLPKPPSGSRYRATLPAACCRYHGPPPAGRGQPGVGTELGGDEDRARRNTAVQHAHRHLRARHHHAVRARLCAASPGADSNHGRARASGRRRHSERGLLHAVHGLRAAGDRNLAGGGAHLHDADLGGVAGVSDPGGTVERRPGERAPAVCRRTGGAGLSPARIG